MWLTTYFQNAGTAATGLSPIIRIRNVVDGSVVSSGTMTELGDGLYAFDFSGYDIEEDYAILCDAVTLPAGNRYKFLSSGEYGDIIDTVGILSDNIEIRTLLVKKILANKLELADGDTANWVLYDDDDTSVLATWDVTDKTDSPIEEQPYGSSRRTRGQ
jgi:hypothetical protein